MALDGVVGAVQERCAGDGDDWLAVLKQGDGHRAQG